MSGDWMQLSEAASILKARGHDPRPCISSLIAKEFWKPVQPFERWARSNGKWLGKPEFDIHTSRMIVEVNTLRRGPAGLDAARQWRDILVSRAAIDDLWPEKPPQPATAKANVVKQAEKYFSEVIVRGNRVNSETALELLRERFPNVSENHFLEKIWPTRPPEWRRKGPIPSMKGI